MKGQNSKVIKSLGRQVFALLLSGFGKLLMACKCGCQIVDLSVVYKISAVGMVVASFSVPVAIDIVVDEGDDVCYSDKLNGVGDGELNNDVVKEHELDSLGQLHPKSGSSHCIKKAQSIYGLGGTLKNLELHILGKGGGKERGKGGRGTLAVNIGVLNFVQSEHTAFACVSPFFGPD
ncbi:hypothetical protein STEG23_035851 [Scotinomys teguina]